MPVRCCSSLSTLTTASRFLLVSAERGPFGGDVAVVEAVERRAELLEELEGDADAADGVFDRIVLRLPRPEHGARPEGIAARAPHRVPIGHAEAQVVLHRLAFDQFVLVVVAEGQRVVRFGAFEADFGDFGKRGHGWTPGKWVVG